MEKMVHAAVFHCYTKCGYREMDLCNTKDFKQARARAYSQDEDAGSFTACLSGSPCKLESLLVVKRDQRLPGNSAPPWE